MASLRKCRELSVVLAVLLSAWFALAQAPKKAAPAGGAQSATKSAKTSGTKKSASAKSAKVKKAYGVSQAACSHNPYHGDKINYFEVDCPSTCTDSASRTFDVDQSLDHPGDPAYDPDICLRPAKSEVMTWHTAHSDRVLRIEKVATGNAKPGHPFEQDPTFVSGGAGTDIVSPGVRGDAVPTKAGKCYLFKSYVEVQDNHG